MIQVGDDLPDLELKVIKKGEIKDMRLSVAFADHSLLHPKNKCLWPHQISIVIICSVGPIT